MADDWATRSAGAVLAVRLQTQGEINLYKFPNGSVGQVSLDTTNKPEGATGSLTMSVLNSDLEGGASALIPFGRTFVNGNTFWVSFRTWAPPQHCYQSWATSSGTGGTKFGIISNQTGSFQSYEVTWSKLYQRNTIQAYWQNGNFNNMELGISSALNSSDIREQPSINNGINPLTGTDPDTGSAWSAAQQDRRRYGSLYFANALADYRTGYGDPIDGGFRHYPNEWLTLTTRITIGTFGSANNRVTKWCARENQPYVMVADMQNITIGGVGDGPYDAAWLTGFATNRIAGGRKITNQPTNITGVTLHVCGNSTPIGNGTLSYTAATQRFQWKGNGESFGTARGFSVANNKLTLNVISTGDSYVVLTVNPGSLPGSDKTDIITIADGRPDTQLNFADFIVSTNPINAPGGFLPLSRMGQLAQSLSAGQWATLETTGLSGALTSTDNGDAGAAATGATCTYANSLSWDPVTQKLFFAGSDHYFGPHTTEHVKFVTFDDKTNNWSGSYSNHPAWWQDPISPYGVSHQYENNAFSASDRYFYCRHSSDDAQLIRRYNADTAVWDTLPTNSFENYPTWSGCLRFFPGYGLIHVKPVGSSTTCEVYRWNEVTDTWSELATAFGYSPDYSPVICYSPFANLMFFGGGSGTSLMWFKLTSTGVVTRMNDVPIDFISKYVVLTGSKYANYIYAWGADGSMRRYDITLDSWTTIDAVNTNRFAPTVSDSGANAVHCCLGTYVDSYNVTVIAKYNGNSSQTYLFKDAAAPTGGGGGGGGVGTASWGWIRA
jgi:hypothetical protein